MNSFFVVCLLFAPMLTEAATPTATELLEKADRARGGLEGGLVWNANIETLEDGDRTLRGFEIKALGDNATAKATSPARNKGEVFLFNKTTMWFYKRGLRKPMGISSRQRLSGQAANGDIANTHYSRDYEAKIIRSEKVGNNDCYVLDLKAKDKSVTYDRIRYWISKGSGLGLKAEFLSLSGQPLKSATFEYNNKIQVSGKPTAFVSKMHIIDARRSSNQSILTYENPKVKTLSKSLFNVNNLGR